ncbi:MAG: M28 family peptidase [Bacteroidia bacterium]|nr:M28 family peptidase [Bacteroidia bacterium]
MKRILCSIAALVCCVIASAQNPARQQRLTDYVYYFASDSLCGRKAGTSDAGKAAAYIAKEYASVGLKPFFPEGWYDQFRAKRESEYCYRNVVGVIEGSDPALKDQYIVLGAHYDHLGVINGEVYNGADDNASGSASLIEVARRLCANRKSLGRSVIIAAFDAEELGLYGSSHLAERLDSLGVDVRLMMSIDMVGWLKVSEALELEGTATIKNGDKMLWENAQRLSLTIRTKRYENSIFTATDTEGFAKKSVPTLAVSTGLKSPYHKPEDDAEKIDYEGLDKITEFIGNVAEQWSSDPSFSSSGRVAPKHRKNSACGVDFGMVGTWTLSSLRFPESGISTGTGNGWGCGIEVEMNIKNFGIWADVLYNRTNCLIPSMKDPFSTPGKYKRNEMLMPVSLVLQTPRNESLGGGIYLGAGFYWSKGFSSEISVPDGYPELSGDQWGGNITAGIKLGSIQLGAMCLLPFSSIFKTGAQLEAKRNCSMITLKYIF